MACRRAPLPFWSLGWALGLFAACNETLPSDADERAARWMPELEYTLDATDTSTGSVGIELRYRPSTAGDQRLIQAGTHGGVWIDSIRAEVDGEPVRVDELVGDDGPLLEIPFDSGAREVVLRYRARPEGVARHGHDGIVQGDRVLVAGHVFWVPHDLARAESDTDGQASSRIRVRVRAPENATVVSSMSGDPREGFDPALNGRWPIAHLGMSNIALGAFASSTRNIGGTQLRVHVPQAWETARRLETFERIARLLTSYWRHFQCEDLTSYTVIFVPPLSNDAEPRVTGASWSTGIALAPDAYPEARRPWELLAHRLAHTFNKYEVCGGFRIPRASDHWFLEGWATWNETAMLREAHVIETDDEIDNLAAKYARVALGLSRQARDRPLGQEAYDISPSDVEYLHYTKSVLVMQMFDRELRRVSNGEKTINTFMATIWPQYRNGRRGLDLFQALEDYSGHDFRPLRRRYIEQTSFLYPLSEHFLATLAVRAADNAPPAPPPLGPSAGSEASALRSGADGSDLAGFGMSEARRTELASYLQDNRLVSSEQVDAEIRSILRLHDEYVRRNADFIPRPIAERANALPPDFRYLLYMHERSELMEPAELSRFLVGPDESPR